MKFTTPYTHDKERSAFYATINNEPSMTQQSDVNETDINVIVGKFFKTGQLPNVTMQAISGDFTSGEDFKDMMDRLNQAKEAFNQLPAKTRKEFDNNPATFIEAAANPENKELFNKLGLLKPVEPAKKTLDDINATLESLPAKLKEATNGKT